jgi:rhodanese-related sulfurtransferase
MTITTVHFAHIAALYAAEKAALIAAMTPAARALLEGPQPPTLVDVRSIEEYVQEHIPGALSVPLPDLANGSPTVLPEDREGPILTVCKVGERSLHGMLLLKALGYQRVRSVRGGIKAWVEAGFPTST